MKRAVAQVSREIAGLLDKHPTLVVAAHRGDLQRWLLLLNPPKEKKARRPLSSRKVTIKYLDRLCRAVVFARDKSTCQKCGKTSGLLDWAHIYARNNYRTRWSINPPGSIVLCRGCHLWWHHFPSETGPFFESLVGSAVSMRLHALHGGRGGKTELSLVRLSLERDAKTWGVDFA